jgi:hypothetical protein
MKRKRSKIFEKKLKENYKKQDLAVFIIDEKPVFKDMKNDFLFMGFMEDEFPKWNLTEEQAKGISYIEFKPPYISTNNSFRKKHKFRKKQYKKAIHIEGILNRYWFRARFPYPKEMWKNRTPRKLKKRLKKENN